MTGWFEFWNKPRGFGFIHTENGESYFTHITNCEGFVPIKGQLVTFEPGRGDRGPIAIRVQLCCPIVSLAGGAR